MPACSWLLLESEASSLMNRRNVNIVVILLVLAVAIWIVLPNNPGINLGKFTRSLETVLGLDLQGGMQILLEADLPESTTVDPQSLQDVRTILENRSNALGVGESNFQTAGSRRVVGEFPGITDTQQVVNVIKQTGLLEFVAMDINNPAPVGSTIQTDFAQSGDTSAQSSVPTAQPTPTTDPLAASGAAAVETAPTEAVYHTVVTGAALDQVGVTTDQMGEYVVSFSLKPDSRDLFAQHTTQNVGQILAIVLDKQVISTPRIDSAITQGSGLISGNFSNDSANNLAVQLRYGALPVPMKVVESRIVGPTLGQDSLNKSIIAGAIGFLLVVLFMTIYYRLPGVLAILAILSYATITLALFKFIPVTLTLPGIAGFLLSTGGALDANILMFERLKEELHGGRNLRVAVEYSWKRAWPSIRDSNVATLITSAILFWFGSAYGATIVKGFALTLALGMIISLFSAIMITRTLLSIAADAINPADHARWFGA